MAAGAISVSMVLPNYNHAVALNTSLAAIIAQKQPANEIIVVDDGSTDNSISVIEGFAAVCPAIRIVRHQQRLGVAAAVNRGIEEARSNYVILTSADEKISFDMTAELANAVMQFPEVDLGVSFYSEWYPETGVVKVHNHHSDSGMWYAPTNEPFLVRADQLHDLLRKKNVFLHVNTAIFKRQALIDVGGFDPMLRWHSDWFAIYAIAFRSGFCSVPRALSWFRMDQDSYSSQGIRNSALQHEVMLNIVDKLNQPQFEYFRRALLHAPAAMSPFMRSMLIALARHPRHFPEFFWISCWWLNEFSRGRRPAAWAARIQKLRNLFRGRVV